MAFSNKKRREPAFPDQSQLVVWNSQVLVFRFSDGLMPVRDNYKSIIFQLSMHYCDADSHYLTGANVTRDYACCLARRAAE